MATTPALTAEQKSIRRSRRIGLALFLPAVLLFCWYLFRDAEAPHSSLLLYASLSLLLAGVLFLLPINYFIFDVEDWKPNDTARKLVNKLRLRGLVYTNLSILVLVIAVFVIVFSCYQLAHPTADLAPKTLEPNLRAALVLTSQVGAVVVLIFLVQILFRVFKYLVRIGGFYNGKADAIELSLTPSGKGVELPKLLDSFTPQAYDISDVESPVLYSTLR